MTTRISLTTDEGDSAELSFEGDKLDFEIARFFEKVRAVLTQSATQKGQEQ